MSEARGAGTETGTVLMPCPSVALAEGARLGKQNSISQWDGFLTGKTQEALSCQGTAES